MVKNSLQEVDAKETCLHPKNWSVSFQKRQRMFSFHYFRVFIRCVLVRVPFSEIYGFQNLPENVSLSCDREAYPSHYHRFQKMPTSCERSLITLQLSMSNKFSWAFSMCPHRLLMIRCLLTAKLSIFEIVPWW